MSDTWREPIRRNSIHRSDLPAMAAISAASGAGALFAGCRPTGAPLVDAVLVVALAAGTVWLGASASWWVLVVAGTIATAGSGGLLGTVVAIVAVGLGLWLGHEQRSMVPLRCLSAALIVQVLLRLDTNPFFGASAVIAGVGLLLLIGVSAQRRRRPIRRVLIISALAAAGLALLAAAGFGASVASARSDLVEGYDGVLDGLSLLQSGDAVLAANSLHDAADALQRADEGVSAVWSQPARLVPFVAQHRNALADIVDRSAVSAEAAAQALDVIDLDALTIRGGVIDVDAAAALAEPLAQLEAAVANLSEALDDADSPWLVGPARERLARYRRRADQAAVQAHATATAAATGPAMLGIDGPRRYLLAFCTPAEARGAGGVMGNYAVITIDQGQLSRTGFGRTTDLVNELGAQGNVPVDVSPEFATRYGRYGLDESGAATPAMWSNFTMTPDVPSAASLLSQLWEGTGHEPLDGVFFIDPNGLAALLKSTGPITVTGLGDAVGSQLDSTNLERFLLVDQYAADTPERIDVLAQVATAALDAVLGGELPGPQILSHDLGPAATTGHLSGWATRPEEEELLRAIGMDAALPPLDGRDGVAVVTNNATANKIDSFLQRTVRYDATTTNGSVDATLTITLHNTAPSTGYPDYVLRSEFLDLPPGTNRTLLTVYSALGYTNATLDGRATSLTTDTELGWNAFTVELDLRPGETRTVVLTLTGNVASDYSLVVRPQPLAHEDAVSINVGGDVQITSNGEVDRRSVIDEHGVRALR
jgi:hypothetical protein